LQASGWSVFEGLVYGIAVNIFFIRMEIEIIREQIDKEELIKIVKDNYEDMVKVDVDVKRGILAIGGEWHSEGDELLNKDGSKREDVWGANFYPWREADRRIEYNSLINIKPSIGHKKMEVQDVETKQKMREIIEALLLSSDETI
jgi:hypothetical protein